MADKTEQKKAWVRIVSKAWADEVYKQRLLNNPAAVLAEEGFKVPEGVNVEVFEQGKADAYFLLPEPLEASDLAELEERLAAGACESFLFCDAWWDPT
ncbi:NHLP leader peptide family RiPP precursor [Maridesulfovibrio sp.]|uniref:NHLP leader peptide family RiPP precursor n=1 Tax=Maridesulfovibrio sp. TaxID=2795000 RepID=UPI0029C9F230|nr:NHLP leader peptide family RiPP precursor [Maridesulfovibrio sp.]